jgi:sulfoxide reductase heme-binding subunit YedZ
MIFGLDELAIAHVTGLLAIALLALSLLAGLHPKTISKRRTLGLLAFAAALAHAAYTIASPLVEDLSHLFYEPHLRAGATVLLVLAILAITSFPARLRVREWKALHRLVYVAALLALHHLWLSSHATRLALWLPTLAIAFALLFRVLRSQSARLRALRGSK